MNVFTLLLNFLFLPKMVIDGEGRPSNGIEPETSLELVLCIYDKELF